MLIIAAAKNSIESGFLLHAHDGVLLDEREKPVGLGRHRHTLLVDLGRAPLGRCGRDGRSRALGRARGAGRLGKSGPVFRLVGHCLLFVRVCRIRAARAPGGNVL
jgi:hypothetical protein